VTGTHHLLRNPEFSMTRTRTVAWTLAAGSALALAVAGIGASAAGSPAAERQATMKDTGLAMKDSAGFATGQTAWDAAKVKGLMDRIAANGKKLHGLYPVGSGADPKSEADPKIWTNKADFDKRLTELSALATKAGKAKTADEFKPGFLGVSGTCKSCHDIYRKKKT
jgi:cytochrome c556